MIDFKEKIVAVTGAARGIGKTIAERFARQGAHVFVCDRDQAAGEALVGSLRTAGHQADLVHVNLGGSLHLSGSPYAVEVLPLSPEPGNSVLLGDGLTAATAGTPATFAVQLRLA